MIDVTFKFYNPNDDKVLEATRRLSIVEFAASDKEDAFRANMLVRAVKDIVRENNFELDELGDYDERARECIVYVYS